MHHDTCVTHVPWCMSKSLTRHSQCMRNTQFYVSGKCSMEHGALAPVFSAQRRAETCFVLLFRSNIYLIVLWDLEIYLLCVIDCPWHLLRVMHNMRHLFRVINSVGTGFCVVGQVRGGHCIIHSTCHADRFITMVVVAIRLLPLLE